MKDVQNSVSCTLESYIPFLPDDVSDIKNWTLLGDGLSTVVFLFIGDDPSFSGKVMGVHKRVNSNEYDKKNSLMVVEFEQIFRRYLPIPEKVLFLKTVLKYLKIYYYV